MDKDLQSVLAAMTPEVYQRLATAVELGKWPDGVALTPAQKAHSLQLVMLWQSQHNEQAQHMSIAKGGEIVTKSKKQLKQELGIDDDITRLTLH